MPKLWYRGPLRAATLGVAVVALVQAVAASAPADAPQGRGARRGGVVYRIPVHGVIELGLAPFIERSLREAAETGARAAVLDIETPGGRIDAAQHIVNALKDADVPVYAFVNRRAFSAGAMIALATRGIYMRPGSVMGAATPVSGQGEKAPEKIVSAMRSEMRALAESRGLDPRVAEAMVDEDIEIPGLVEKGKLLTLTTEEAVRIRYATAVEDLDALLHAVGVAGAEVRTTEVNWAEGVVRFLTHPMVAPLLLSLGFLGLIIELKTPAFGLAGAAGLISLALFFGSHYIVGLAGWEELILLTIGLILLGIEIFVVPGFGIFGIAGILGILASMYLSLVSHLATGFDYSQAAGILSAAVIVVAVTAWALLRFLPRSGRLTKSGILLGEATTREAGYLATPVRPELEGARGVALTDLRPAGTAQFGEDRVDVVAEGAFIPAGSAIQVIRSEGYRHVVRPVG
ncbi:MAG: nodulation protein NfeD [Gemmatimonadetes bacterium]|nr:nodulation protein NfeD [Gemmatimonadota bacterium]